ncbi:MAG: CerR family C-terminal domain-containing protein [Pirellulaceae bacterium]
MFETSVSRSADDIKLSTDTTDKPVAERLIEIAGEIFASKGNAATIREICAAAGCSIAAVNYYFGDKQQLYARCVEAACERKQRLFPFPRFEQAGAADEQLREFLRTITRRMAASTNLPWQNTLMLRELISPSEHIAEKMKQYIAPDFERLQELVARVIGAETDSPELRRSLVTQIFARCMFFKTGASVRAMLGLDTPGNEDPQLYADEICDSILAQIRAVPRCHGESGK